MRTVSEQWQDNQLEDVAASGVLVGYVETREVVAGEPEVVRWDIDNVKANNVVEAEVTHEFDYSRTALPLDSARVQIENAVYDDEPSDTYDFTQSSVQAQLVNPGTVEFALGYDFPKREFDRFIKVGCYRAGMNLAAVREFESRVGGVKQDLCKRFVGWHEEAPVAVCQELIEAGITPLLTYELWQIDPSEGVLHDVGDFGVDSNSDGVADGWFRSEGTSTVVSHSPGAQTLRGNRTTEGVQQQRWIKGVDWWATTEGAPIDLDVTLAMVNPDSVFTGQNLDRKSVV